MSSKRYYSISLILFGLIATFIIHACASTSYGLQEPHLYNNSFDQVLTTIEKVLQDEQMVIMNAEKLEGGDLYKIYFFKKSGRIDERNFETGHTAEINIRKVEDRITSVEIKEEYDRALTRDEYREHLARDVFKGLEERLKLIPKNQQDM